MGSRWVTRGGGQIFPAFPALTQPFPRDRRPDKYLGARTVCKSSNPLSTVFPLSMASTGCRHGATARPDLDKIDLLSRCGRRAWSCAIACWGHCVTAEGPQAPGIHAGAHAPPLCALQHASRLLVSERGAGGCERCSGAGLA